MHESTITAKGQTTVPVGIRERVGVKPGSRLVWHVLPNGTLIVRAKIGKILDLAGTVKPARRGKVSVDDMNAWR
jgi:AbrB family looped-hinge helix DNA binding protein